MEGHSVNVSTKTIKNNKPTGFKFKAPKTFRELDRPTSPWMEDYKDFFTHRMHPVSEAFLETIGAQFIEWAEKTDVLKPEWFFTQKRIPPRTAWNWANKNENFKTTCEMAKLIIGMRREHGALNRTLSEAMVIRRQHAYDPDWAADKAQDKQDKIDISKATAEGIDRPTQIILGELPGMKEYKSLQEEKELVE